MSCLRAAALVALLAALPGCILGNSVDDGTGGAGSGVGAGGSDPEPASMAGMLEAHNQVRADVVPAPDTPLEPLAWDAELATVAQAYAERCVWEHSQNGYGENLYASAGQPSTPQKVVSSWASEVAMYDYATNGCSGVCGHYTQIVWADTRRVGCGMAACSTGSPLEGFTDWESWVCNYDPPGNWVGERPY